MKGLTAKLKNLNFKALLVDHGEKIGMAVIVLVAGLALAGTQWSGYDGVPAEFVSKAESARQQISASTWPDSNRQEFPLVDFLDDSRQLVTPINLSLYDYSTPMRWPLYRKRERIREPEWLAIEELVATPGRAIVAVLPEGSRDQLAEGEAAGDDLAANDPANPFDDEFAVRTGAGGPPGVGGPMGPGAGMTGPMPGMPASPGGIISSGGEYGGGPMMAEMMGGMSGGMMGPSVESRGVRFIAVRGVYPLRKQVEKVARAMNLQVSSDAMSLVQFLDFKLQRKTAMAGDDPWAGEWEDVDIDVAMEVLNEVDDFDVDPVDSALTDAVFTMPLPRRLLGYWGRWANHPKLKNFELSPEEQARENELNAKLIAKYEAIEAKRPKRVEAGGFATLQRNMRDIRYDVMQESGQEFMNDYMQSMDSAPMMQAPDMRKPSMAQLKNRLTAVGRVLLFRYFDFDVEPGRAYQYRVQMELRNPSFDLPLDQVVDQSVAEGQKRTTPWSEPSEVAVMPPDVDYFVDDIERDPLTESLLVSWGDDPGRVRRPLIDVEMFQWDPSLGTIIADKLNVRLLGSFIGGAKETTVLDVGAPSLEKKDRNFHSDDLLLDIAKVPPVDPAIHPDLQLSKDALASLTDGEMLVVDAYGDLATVNPKSNTAEQARLRSRVERQRQPFENMAAQPEASELDMIAAEYGMMGMEMGAEQTGRRGRRQRNATRLRGNSSAP